MGYTTVALAQTVSGKIPANLSPPAPPPNAPKSLTLLTRVNLTLTDTSQNARIAPFAQSYSLVAIRPTNEKTFSLACTSLDCDLISLDLSARLPFHFKFKTVAAAVSRGVRLEICYGPGITGSGFEARRNLIGNATALIRATRGGRGIIISSEAWRALGVRAPWDVVNLACVWGLQQERGREAVSEEARKVVALAELKRRSWRGTVDVIYGGELKAAKSSEAKNEGGKKNAGSSTQTPGKDGNAAKRKASGEVPAEESEKPISKREMKRRAKKARLEASGVSTPGKTD